MSTGFFRAQPPVEAVLLVNSCARGVAIVGSDLDMAVLVAREASPAIREALEEEWRALLASDPALLRFQRSGAFTRVHVDVFDEHMRAIGQGEITDEDVFRMLS